MNEKISKIKVAETKNKVRKDFYMVDLNKYYISGMDYPVTNENDNKVKICIESGKKQSTMTYYHILEGIDVTYNNFNSSHCPFPKYNDYSKNIIEINHCRQGRYGCIINNKQCYLGIGEIEANIHNIPIINPEFSVGFYEGVTILIDIPSAKQNLESMFPDMVSNLDLLKDAIEKNNGAIFLGKVPELNYIFKEIYEVKSEIKMTYITLKVLELLLMIKVTPLQTNKNQKYYDKDDIDKVKAIHKLITKNIDNKYTLEALSKTYNISLTQLKNCFKEVYGMPYYTYLKHYKIHRAVHYIEETNLSISQISSKLGYDNASKFISAFKSILNCTPREYRNKNVLLEHLDLFGVEIE